MAYSIAAYYQLVSGGYPMKAMKYEDIVKDPTTLFTALLNHADIPLSKLPDIKKVLSNDSQAGTDWTSRKADATFLEGKQEATGLKVSAKLTSQ